MVHVAATVKMHDAAAVKMHDAAAVKMRDAAAGKLAVILQKPAAERSTEMVAVRTASCPKSVDEQNLSDHYFVREQNLSRRHHRRSSASSSLNRVSKQEENVTKSE
jgi:hypothetical protein